MKNAQNIQKHNKRKKISHLSEMQFLNKKKKYVIKNALQQEKKKNIKNALQQEKKCIIMH